MFGSMEESMISIIIDRIHELKKKRWLNYERIEELYLLLERMNI